MEVGQVKPVWQKIGRFVSYAWPTRSHINANFYIRINPDSIENKNETKKDHI